MSVWLTTMILAGWVALSPPTTPPGLPTLPPPLPTYVVTDNGERLDCTPNYETCWTER